MKRRLTSIMTLFPGLFVLFALAVPASHAESIEAAEMSVFDCTGFEIASRSDLGTVDFRFELQRTNPSGLVAVITGSFPQNVPKVSGPTGVQFTSFLWSNFPSIYLVNGALDTGDYVIVNSPKDDPIGRTATLVGFNTIPLHYSAGPVSCEAAPFCGDGILDPGEECDDGNNINGDGCDENCTVEDEGEGCTPGYWKNHLDKWGPTGLSTGDDFDSTFGVDLFSPDITLGEAIKKKGGGVKKVARHGTAALLSARHPGISYPATVAAVIAAVQSGNVNGLVMYNELSDRCPAEDF
jgi:cysteine-rich repeat protein